MARALAPGPLRYRAAALAWLANALAVGDPADMLITNAAVRAFYAEPELRRERHRLWWWAATPARTTPRNCSGSRPPGSLAGGP